MDVWAPGVDIEAASPDCFECTATYSGTSQATPMVTGLIAQYLSAHPNADAFAVRDAMQKHAARHVLMVFGHPYDTMSHLYAQVWTCFHTCQCVILLSCAFLAKPQDPAQTLAVTCPCLADIYGKHGARLVG